MTTAIKPRAIVISTTGGTSTLNAISLSVSPQTQLLDMSPGNNANGTPRKRQRLTHLTPDERMMRRKLKNRVAAQLARDRKRDKMMELDSRLDDIQQENRRLMEENEALRRRTEELSSENNGLRQQLVGGRDSFEASVKSEALSPESAAFSFGSLQQNRTGSKHLTMASTAYLSLLITLSLTSLFSSKRSLGPLLPKVKAAIAALRASSGHVRKPQRKPRQLRPQHGGHKWWGPQQQSWNPSKNL